MYEKREQKLQQQMHELKHRMSEEQNEHFIALKEMQSELKKLESLVAKDEIR